MKLALAAVLVAGCSFPTPSEQYSCRTTDDCDDGRVCTQGYCVLGSVVDIDAPMADTTPMIDCTTFLARHFDACMIPSPGGDLALTTAGTYTFDTTAGSLLAPGGGSSLPPSGVTANGRVVSIGSLTVGPGVTLRVIGTYPLIVASWGTIDVSGTIDAGSLGTPATLGAGANPTGCASHAAIVGQSNIEGAGGGGGGGGQASGGRGGVGDLGNGGNGGTTIAAPLLLGGCPGASGGTGSSAAGAGGDGGGAIQLTARVSISIAGTGKVLAGGAGGKPAGQSGNGGGGGGGGAGGMVGLEAPMLSVASGGVLAANGGGGGQGGGNTVGNAGQNGQPSAVRANGGNIGSGGIGGLGSGGITIVGQNGGNDTAGGGGGGGAAGFIAYKAATRTIDAAAIVSPAGAIIP